MTHARNDRRPDLDRRLHFLLRRLSAAQRGWDLIADGDRVLLGLSGGKDSVTLLHLLLAWRRVAPVHFELAALHVEQDAAAIASADRPAARRLALESLAASLGIDLSFTAAPRTALPWPGRPRPPASVGAEPATRAAPSPCFRCAWLRREALFRFAAARGFNKVALAHHLDDAAQTVLMNLLFHGEVAGLEPRRDFFDGKVVLIRPLILAEGREIRRVAALIDFPFANCDCPHAVESERARADEFLRAFGRRARAVKRNLWRAARMAAAPRAAAGPNAVSPQVATAITGHVAAMPPRLDIGDSTPHFAKARSAASGASAKESGMSIAITAPTGHIGSQLVHRLLAAGAPVTLLVRDRRKVAEHVKRGARVAEGSLADASFVTEATKGAEALFWLTPPDPTSTDLRGYQARLGQIAADAVRRNNISRVVNVSSIGADLGHGTGPVDGLHDVERALDAAAQNVTHLRCAFFMENFLFAAAGIVKDGSVYFPVKAETRSPMIATRDIAEVAAEYLQGGKDRGRHVVYVYGPADLTFGEAAATLTNVLGRPVKHVAVPPEQAIAAMVQAGLSPHVASLMVELDKSLDEGYLLSGSPAGPDRRTRTTFEQFAREVLRPAFAGMARSAHG